MPGRGCAHGRDGRWESLVLRRSVLLPRVAPDEFPSLRRSGGYLSAGGRFGVCTAAAWCCPWVAWLVPGACRTVPREAPSTSRCAGPSSAAATARSVSGRPPGMGCGDGERCDCVVCLSIWWGAGFLPALLTRFLSLQLQAHTCHHCSRYFKRRAGPG